MISTNVAPLPSVDKAQGSRGFCDVLMIAHNRPEYLALALPALLKSGDATLRVWVWQNGENESVTKVIDRYTNHPRMYKLHRSPQNEGLRAPTNWLWSESDSTYVGKVDDDTLVSHGWLDDLRSAHERVPRFGVLGCWVHPASDYDAKIAKKKISRYQGVNILENPWMAGSAYIMKRGCVHERGLLTSADTFPHYCIGLAWAGWIHGWLLPLILAEHMDDPRSTKCILKTQEDFERFMPLTAVKNNVKTLEEWKALNRISAVEILKSGKKAGRLFWIRRLYQRAIRKLYGDGA